MYLYHSISIYISIYSYSCLNQDIQDIRSELIKASAPCPRSSGSSDSLPHPPRTLGFRAWQKSRPWQLLHWKTQEGTTLNHWTWTSWAGMRSSIDHVARMQRDKRVNFPGALLGVWTAVGKCRQQFMKPAFEVQVCQGSKFTLVFLLPNCKFFMQLHGSSPVFMHHL